MSPQVRHVSAFEGYELWAPTYDATPNPIVAMDARHALDILEPRPGELVLDAGCGTGRNLAAIARTGASVVGIDFSPRMLDLARDSHPGVPLALADLRARLPFVDGAFDAVLCTLVGEHLSGLGAALSELRRVLGAGGRLVFTVYHPALAAAGVQAGFQRDGVEYRLASLPHSVQDYLDLTLDAGFDAIGFAEYRGDRRLADDVHEAEKYLGAQVLLLIAATA